MKEQNNKGFTLVELLVVIVILSIVLSSVTAMMVTGSRSFAKGNADAQMQRQAQLVVDQIEDMIIDTNGGIDFVVNADSKDLIMYNRESDGAGGFVGTKEVVSWKEDTKEITYSMCEVTYNGSEYTDGADICTEELLAEKVNDFNVDVSDTVDDYNEKGEQVTIVQSVQIVAEYVADSGATAYATTPVITLRNRMMLAGNPEMIFEEPPYVEPVPDRELAVQVEVLGFTKIPQDWVMGENGAWVLQEESLAVKCRGTIIKSGFEDDELEYQWSASIPVSFPNGNTNPDECEVRIGKAIWDQYAGQTIDITLTAIPKVEYADGPQSATAPFRVPTSTEGDTYHERGRDHGEDYYSIDNTVNGDRESITIEVRDENGNLYENQAELIALIQILDDPGGFKFNVKEGLDPSLEYYVYITVHTTKGIDITKMLYIPRVAIEGKMGSCPWQKWMDGNFVYGNNNVGTGIQYVVSGYYLGSWNINKYRVDVENWILTEDSKLPDGKEVEVVLTKQLDRADSTSANQFKLTFMLDVKAKDGTALTPAEKDAIKLSSIKVKLTMEEYPTVFGYATVNFY